jgi:phenylpropionate dioxygenase-like ring-hydroxylating dioxygenase large terminal subunit
MLVPPQQITERRNTADGESVVARAPPAAQFPAYPASWYLFARARELRGGPVSKLMWGRRLVGYRTSAGAVVVMDGQCCHLGADLGRGRVVGDAIECPFHNWRFGPDGRCQHIPATEQIPAFAKQSSFPVVERHGLIFVYRGVAANFALPFFPDSQPEDFSPARPFTTDLDCPWYLVGANAFDLQHFRAAHDRRLVGEPVVECPAAFARRATATFTVASDSLRDRVTRWFAGVRVEMSITDWCGNLLFAGQSSVASR